jgi:hypothetical protein
MRVIDARIAPFGSYSVGVVASHDFITVCGSGTEAFWRRAGMTLVEVAAGADLEMIGGTGP